MKGGGYLALAGVAALLTLAGCGRGFFQMEERAPWRHEAEAACMKAGTVKLGAGVVRMEPIDGPGACGTDFPLKVSMLGESPALMSYGDEPVPPGSIPNAYDPRMPRWPASQPRYTAPVQPIERQPIETQPLPSAPPPAYPQQAYPQQSIPQQNYPQQSYPQQGQRMRWTTGPPGIDQRQVGSVPGRPLPLNPQGAAPADDIPDDAVLPPGRSRGAPAYPQPQGNYALPQDNYPPAQNYPPSRQGYNQPAYQPPPQQRALPPLGPNATTAMMPATVTPPATLACPLVSALDRWISEGVQPAALHWFGSPVVTIKQISSYSCRGMVGGSGVSEHAFGNALDVAAFTLADGRAITVKNGWHGTPEEQGFLHDVQLYACETFTTVLAPGYNVYHYDHIHVDLMQRESGRHPCRPDAVPGEQVAAKAHAIYAAQRRGPAYTGSVFSRRGPVAVPGEDGLVSELDGQNTAGSIRPRQN